MPHMFVHRQLVHYLPAIAARRLVARPEAAEQTSSSRFPAALLFADVSGFTPLAVRMESLGPEGAEKLSGVLEACFGRLVDVVSSHGGEVFRFPGDAAIALWTVEEDRELKGAVCAAARCGLALCEVIDQFDAEGAQLSLRVGIGAGEVLATTAGGVEGRWEFFVAGDPLDQMCVAQDRAERGEVVLSPEANVWLGTSGRGTLHGGGFLSLRSVEDDTPLEPQPPVVLPPGVEEVARKFVSRSLLARLDAGHVRWLAEFRKASVLFAKLDGLDFAAPDAADVLHAATRAVQQVVYGRAGSINQFMIDDKGTVVVAAWGLPTRTHEDDAARAIVAATDLQRALRKMDIPCSVGIATGRIYCGNRGGSVRREYALIGRTVNLAARLMQRAAGGVLVDAVTRRAAASMVSLVALPAVKLKGFDTSVPVFSPAPESTPLPPRRVRVAPSRIVGRVRERKALRERVDLLLSRTPSVLSVLEGDAGLGKSVLLDAMLSEARERGVTVYYGAGDDIDRSPYFAWRAVLLAVLGLDEQVEPEACVEVLRERLAEHPELLTWLPVLNGILPISLSETEETSQMSGPARGHAVEEIVIRLLRDVSASGLHLLAIDDAHWLDSLSWSLLLATRAEVPAVGFAVAARPLRKRAPAAFMELLGHADVFHLALQRMSPEDVLALVAQRLDAREVSPEVAEQLRDKAEGHPLFSTELALGMRDAGVLIVDDGVARIAPDADLAQVDLPDTVEAAITSRFDQLSADEQLTLKVASVLGRVFFYETLCDVFPEEADRSRVQESLEHLTDLDVTLLDSPQPNLRYAFKHAVIQDVVYGLLVFEQRRRLHRALAMRHERGATRITGPVANLLAHHWRSAEEPDRAVVYLDLAGEAAVRNFANEEAINQLLEAERLEAAGATPWRSTEDPRLRRANRWCLLAEVTYRMGRYADCIDYAGRALVLLGRHFPANNTAMVIGMVKELVVQMAHRFVARLRGERTGRVHPELAEQARAYFWAAKASFNRNEILPYIYANLASLNLADRGAPSRELAEASGVMGLTAALMQFHGVADTYADRAKDAAKAIGDHPSRIAALMLQSLYLGGASRWDELVANCTEAQGLSERIGDWRGWAEHTALLALAAFYTGDCDRSEVLWQSVYETAIRHGDPQPRSWSLCGRSECALRRGSAEDASLALSLLPEAAEAARSLGVEELIRVSGNQAYAHVLDGDEAAAIATIEKTLRRVKRHARPVSFWSFEGYANTARAALTLWEREEDPRRREARARDAHAACKGLWTYAGVFQLGVARAELLQAIADALAGRPRRTAQRLRKAADKAEALGLPYDRALVRLAAGRLLTNDSSQDRAARLIEARNAFIRLGADTDRDLAATLLSELGEQANPSGA